MPLHDRQIRALLNASSETHGEELDCEQFLEVMAPRLVIEEHAADIAANIARVFGASAGVETVNELSTRT